MKTIQIKPIATEFAEDKDLAAKIRDNDLRPAIECGETVMLDFAGVTGATQSFVHAMISDLIRRDGPDVLDSIQFANCDQAVKYIIQIVSEYSQYEIE
ncbi:MAG TPA: STAS-like domain-containing protein [Sedimentisphaerales bacterium]|jgi:hypothetical protein|nr:STAS-like domain-containing protein [Sedimentisphaerales bacterium]HNU30503.1 STAS-like domain-containing protein [Sedimentisphaerales bacterium]